MNKKAFSLFVVMILAIVSIGGVYAFDLGSLFGDDSQGGDSSQDPNWETINVGGIDFNIPKNFKLQLDDQFNKTIGDVDYISTFKKYYNESEEIYITVSESPNYEATDDTVRELGGDSETINGIEGYLNYTPGNVSEGNNDGNPIYVEFPSYYTFSYAKDGKLVVVKATEKDFLYDIIIK